VFERLLEGDWGVVRVGGGWLGWGGDKGGRCLGWGGGVGGGSVATWGGAGLATVGGGVWWVGVRIGGW